MSGLIKKDIYEACRSGANKLLTIITPCIIAITMLLGEILGRDHSVSMVGLFFSPLMVGIGCLGSTTSDSVSRWNVYSMTTPCSRSDIVNAKYIFSLICQLYNMALHGLILLLLYIFDTPVSASDLTWFLMMTVSSTMLLAAVFFPINLLIRDRTAKSVLGALIGGIAGSVYSIVMTNVIDGEIVDRKAALIMTAVFAVMFILSWIISLNAFKNRDVV